MTPSFWAWLRSRQRRWLVVVLLLVVALAVGVTIWELLFVMDVLAP